MNNEHPFDVPGLNCANNTVPSLRVRGCVCVCFSIVMTRVGGYALRWSVSHKQCRGLEHKLRQNILSLANSRAHLAADS